jgi:transposase InsO family protein
MQVEHDGAYKDCALGKNAKKSFANSDSRSEGIVDIIYSDVCRQMTVPSLGNFVYYVIFIDDYSRKTWIYFLKAKDEVFSKFQDFKALVENLSGRKIKILRFDNGGEYNSNEFTDYCREARIKRELKTPYNAQQNGVAERKNRSIVEVAKAMIHDQNIPMHLWVEASSTTVYVHNISPHKILGNKTPEEVFTGKKPKVSHLRIFGCPVYMHVPNVDIMVAAGSINLRV